MEHLFILVKFTIDMAHTLFFSHGLKGFMDTIIQKRGPAKY